LRSEPVRPVRRCRHMKRQIARLGGPITLAIMLAGCGQPENTPSPGTPVNIEAAPPEPSSPSYAATPEPGMELPPSQTTPGPIPLEFRHVWAIEPGDCTAAPGMTRMAIAPGAIKFYEGRSEVVSANAAQDGALTLRVSHASEGQTVTETHILALDEAKTTLTYQRGGNSFTYRRCD